MSTILEQILIEMPMAGRHVWYQLIREKHAEHIARRLV